MSGEGWAHPRTRKVNNFESMAWAATLCLSWRFPVLVKLKGTYGLDGYLVCSNVCGLALTVRNIFSRDFVNVKIQSLS